MAVPAAPSSLTLTKDISDGTFDVTATWASSVGATSGYTLGRSYNGAAFVELSANMSGLTFEDLDLSAAGRYVYRIAAENVDGLSDYSLAAINISYADIGAVQSGGADIGAVQGSAPVTGAVNLVGGTSGMAPFPVHWYADIDGVGSTWATGSGEWCEGRSQLRVIDNGTGEVYVPSDSNHYMPLTCPISGKEESCFDRISGMPYGAAVIWDAGSYKCQIRYQNRDGDWSAWADSSTITVSADTRTAIYVDGASGDDGNDGSSWAQAKLTLGAAGSILSASNMKIVVKDDTTVDMGTGGVDARTKDNTYITRSYDGTAKPIINQDVAGITFYFGTGFVIDGLYMQYDGVASNRILKPAFANNSNGAILNIDYEECDDFIEFADYANIFNGLLVYGGQQLAVTQGYCWYSTMSSWLQLLGVAWKFGSAIESTMRLGHANGAHKWISVDYCDIDFDSQSSKDAIRGFPSRFFSGYRTSAAQGNWQLGFNNGASTQGFQDFRVDCSRFRSIRATSLSQNLIIAGGMTGLRIASSLVYRKNPNNNPAIKTDSNDGMTSETISNVGILNCSLFGSGNGSALGTAIASFTNVGDMTFEDYRLNGCVIQSDDATQDDNGDKLVEQSTLSVDVDTEVNENVWFDHSTLAPILVRDGTNPTTASALNALSYASGNVDGTLTIDPDTAAITGGTPHQGIVTDITGVFESLTAGTGYTTEIDRTLGAWDAGAVQRDSLLIEDPTYIDPISLSGTINGDDVDLEWNLVTQTIDGYEVQRRTDGGSWETITVT